MMLGASTLATVALGGMLAGGQSLTLEVADTASFADAPVKAETKILSDGIALAELIALAAGIALTDGVTFADSTLRHVASRFSDVMALVDAALPEIPLAQTFPAGFVGPQKAQSSLGVQKTTSSLGVSKATSGNFKSS
jgi:hypothetical protein